MPSTMPMRDPILDLFFAGQNNDQGRFVLPPGFVDPEPPNRFEARLFGINTGLGVIIQAAKIKSYVGARGLSQMNPPVILAANNFRNDQADAYAACYWGSLLGKFLGIKLALQYTLVHEQLQGGQTNRERGDDAFNMAFGIQQIFGRAPAGLSLDLRGGGPDLNNSLAGRSVLAAQRRQLRFRGAGVSPSPAAMMTSRPAYGSR